MKKLTDEELQALFEKGLHTDHSDSQDGKLYAMIFKELANPAPFQLITDLDAKVVRQLEEQQIKAGNKQYNRAVAMVGIIALVFIAMVAPFFSSGAIAQAGSLLSKHSGIVIFFGVAVMAIEFTDKLLIRKRPLSNRLG